MADLLAAFGIALVLEGVLYALAPDAARRLAEMARSSPTETLRIGGIVAVAAGTGIVWLARG